MCLPESRPKRSANLRAEHSRSWRRATLALAALLLLLLGGCQAFRVQIGGGIGLGADIKLPGLCHTGLSAGQFMNIGLRYDQLELSHDVELNALAFHWSGRQSKGPEHARRWLDEHRCWGWLPELFTEYDTDDGLSAWDFEIGIMALVLDFRIGFGPARLDRPAKRVPPPPSPSRRPVPPPPARSVESGRVSDAPVDDRDPLSTR